MAKLRKAIPKKIKSELIKEAGMKCANPGCASYRIHIHHIRQWAVYQTNDEKDMIAICPVCHDTAHNGELIIDDRTLYGWKEIIRSNTTRDQLFVEPGIPSKLLLGSIAVTGDNGLSVFELSPNNRLSFKLVDDDIFLVNMSITDLNGKQILKIVENHVKYQIAKPLRYERRPGKLRITAPATSKYIPDWVLLKMRIQEPQYARDDKFIMLDIEVIKPGLVRVQGVWVNGFEVVIITEKLLSFITLGLLQPLSMSGAGEDSVLYYTGPISTSLFGFSNS